MVKIEALELVNLRFHSSKKYGEKRSMLMEIGFSEIELQKATDYHSLTIPFSIRAIDSEQSKERILFSLQGEYSIIVEEVEEEEEEQIHKSIKSGEYYDFILPYIRELVSNITVRSGYRIPPIPYSVMRIKKKEKKN